MSKCSIAAETKTEIKAEIKIGEWHVFPDLVQISRKDQVLSLEPMAMDVLILLASQPGKLFKTEDIVKHVWQNKYVDNNGIYKLIAQLRKSLDDNPKEPVYIQTVFKRGYRLVAPVSTYDLPVNLSHNSSVKNEISAIHLKNKVQILKQRKWSLTALAVCLCTACYLTIAPSIFSPLPDNADFHIPPTQNSIAVLPFVDLSKNTDQEYFCNGVSEELINILSKNKSWLVTSRTSSFYFKNQNLDLVEIGRKLSVTHILEGSVRKHENQIRVNVQLVDTKNGYQLWSENYNRNLGDIFQIQTDIAENISLKVGEHLISNTIQVVSNTNFESYDLYLLGRHHLQKRTVDSIHLAKDYFEKSLQIDGAFAPAYAGVALAYTHLNFYGTLDEDELKKKAGQAIETALVLDPNLGEAYEALGRLNARLNDQEASVEAFKKALSLAPNMASAYHGYAWQLTEKFQFKKADPFYNMALRLDPLSPIINTGAAFNSIGLGKFHESEHRLRRAIEVQPNAFNAFYMMGVLAWTVRADSNAARSWFNKALAVEPTSAFPVSMLALMNLDLGNIDDAANLSLKAIQGDSSNFFSNLSQLLVLIRQKKHENAYELASSMNKDFDDWNSRRYLRDTLLKQGKIKEARALYLDQLSAGASPDSIVVSRQNYEHLIDLTLVLKLMGQENEASILAKSVKSYLQENVPRLGWSGYWVSDAELSAIMGKNSDAFSNLQKAVNSGWSTLWWFELGNNNNLSSIMHEQQFQEILEELKDNMSKKSFANTIL